MSVDETEQTTEHETEDLFSDNPAAQPAPNGEPATPFSYLGALTGFERVAQGVECASGAARLRVLFVAPRTVRVWLAPDGVFPPRHEWAPDQPPEQWPAVAFSVTEEAERITLSSGECAVEIRRDPLRVRFVDGAGQVFAADTAERAIGWRAPKQDGQGGIVPGETVWPDAVFCRKDAPQGERYYGLGERTGLLDKRGRRYSNWTTDAWDHSPTTDVMYQAIPFMLAVRAGASLAYGIYFNNSYRTRLDLGASEREVCTLAATGGALDYYLIYGPTPGEVLQGYTAITGRMALPPRWALGYQQSRWSYYPEQAVRAVAEGFRRRAIPGEVIHLDIDYMDGFRDFTWDASRFADPARLVADLRAQGFKVVTIIDPGIKYEPGNALFEQGVAGEHFLRDPQGELAHGQVWPGDCVFPDFARAATRAWWGEQHRALLDAGVAGIWNDMNEPSTGAQQIALDVHSGDGAPPATFAEVHNLYGYLEARATYEGLRRQRPDERPFLLTRSGFAGIQRYAAVWTGDNASVWEHLEMALPQLCNLGLSGVAFCGTDIGGFWGNATPELFARWIELGALSPFSRGHSAAGTLPHEPWAFGAEVEGIARRYLELRYRLLPYLTTLFHEAATTGAPILRPLVYHYPDDPAVAALHDQALLGESLLLAPVYRPGVSVRHVYLPAGTWHDYWTDAVFTGPQHLLAPAPLDTLPLYVRAGSIVPTGPTMQYSDERPLDALTLDIYLGAGVAEASGMLYEDDGHSLAYQRGEYRLTRYRYRRTPQGATLSATYEGTYTPAPRRLALRFHGAPIHAATHDDHPLPLRDGAVELPADPGAWTISIEHAPR